MTRLPERFDGVIATIENLSVDDFIRAKGLLVCVFDQRLLGRQNGESIYSVSILAGQARESTESRIVHRDVLTRHEVAESNLFQMIELLGGGSGTSPPSLLMTLDCSNVRVSAIAEHIEDLRRGFEHIELVAICSQHQGALAEAPHRQWMREQNIALAAAGIDAAFTFEEGPSWENFDPAPTNEMAFATALGQVLKSAALAPHQRADRVLVFRADLSALKTPNHAGDRPFISVLTRFHGKRLHTLCDVLCCLSAQECMDFEHLIVAHNLSPETTAELNALVVSQPAPYRSRIRVVPVTGGNRTRPLNVGFAEARGQYVAILDDDDIVFANWIETYRKLALEKPGRLLRATSVRQEYEEVRILGAASSRAISGMRNDYGDRFDPLAHLDTNYTPPVSIAFPRYLFSEFGHRFDETLTTTEDWEYISRGASILGVASSDEITSIYRWWVNAYSSRTEHAPTEWQDNHQRILDMIGARSFILTDDDIDGVRRQEKEYRRLRSGVPWLESEVGRLRDSLRIMEDSVVDYFRPSHRVSQRLSLGLFDKKSLRERTALVTASGLFDQQWYFATYKDLEPGKVDALLHFVRYGSMELRSPGPNFNSRFYFLNNRDVREHRVEPFFHYLKYGMHEGRRPVP